MKHERRHRIGGLIACESDIRHLVISYHRHYNINIETQLTLDEARESDPPRCLLLRGEGETPRLEAREDADAADDLLPARRSGGMCSRLERMVGLADSNRPVQ